MLSRRLALLSPLLLAACGGDGPVRQDFPPMSYDYLTPLRLNVGEVEIRDQFAPGGADIGAQAPIPPAQALRQMAADRIKPGGSTGRAVFVIEDASIVRVAGGVSGAMAVQLDILLADGTRAGFAEARVQRRRTSSRGEDLRGTLYDLVRDMMDDMNVELEFQVRRSLKDWLQVTATAPLPPPVQQQDLGPPTPVRPVP